MKFDQIQTNSIRNLILDHTSIQEQMQVGMNATINYKSLN
jgi:hypothetical protein